MLACAGCLLAACGKDDGVREDGAIDGIVSEGEDAYISFRVNLPKTKAYGTESGETYEQAVNSLNVYIFDADNLSATPVTAGPISISSTADDTKAIKVKRSDKLVLAGVNLTAAITSHISGNSDAYRSFTYSAAAPVTLADVATSGNFVMFNENIDAAKISSFQLFDTPAGAESSPVTLDVVRVVAKATVSLGLADVPVTGGTVDFSGMTYGWRNMNNYLTLVTDNNNQYKDSNWNPATTNYGDFSPTTGVADLSVNAYNATINSYAYTTENTLDLSAGAKVKDATYLSIATKFIPENVWEANGGNAGDLSDFTLTVNTNYPSTAVDFWIVELNDGTTNYFLDQATAVDFAAAATAEGMYNDTYVPADKKYTDGNSYYHVFVNTSPETDTQNRGYTQFNVYRNQYFKVVVNAINGPGLPTDTDDEEDPLQPTAYIDVLINVLDWTTVDEPVTLE